MNSTKMRLPVGLSLALALPLMGCGKFGNPRGIEYAPEGTYAASGVYDTNLEGSVEGNYQCPAQANVVPDYDYHRDGSGRYTVCQNRSDRYAIRVHGFAYQSNRICVFPAQVVDQSHIYTKPDLDTGAPWSKCVSLSDETADFTFDSTSYNAVFIVPDYARTQMANCLLGGNYYACPAYSYGQFR